MILNPLIRKISITLIVLINLHFIVGIKTTVDEYHLENIGRDALKSYNKGGMAKAEALLDEGDALYFSSLIWRRIFLNHGDSYKYINISNTLKGRIALQEGKIELAKEFLQKSGDVKSEPTLSSFGPNMSLANDLLAKGETQAALAYLDDCKHFWEYGMPKIEEWKAQIARGERPDFGGNMLY